MNAIFKTSNRILITGSDSDERLLIKDFIEASVEKAFEVKALVDINGDETGLSIELVDRPADEIPSEDVTVDEPEVSEPTPSE